MNLKLAECSSGAPARTIRAEREYRMSNLNEKYPALDKLILKAAKHKALTEKEIVEAIPELEDDLDALETVSEHLTEQGIRVMAEDELDIDEPSPEIIQKLEQEEPPEASVVEVVEELLASDQEEVSADPVRMYLREIGKEPLLTGEDEVTLAKAMKKGEAALAKLRANSHTPEESLKLRESVQPGQRARRRLSEANLRLVVSVAKRFVGRGMSFLDLIQEGNIGLMRAVEKFDYRPRIQVQHLCHLVDQTGHQPRHRRSGPHHPHPGTHGRDDQQGRAHLAQIAAGAWPRAHRRGDLAGDGPAGGRRKKAGRKAWLNSTPMDPLLARKLNRAAVKVRRIMSVSQEPMSLETPIGTEENSSLGDFIEDESVPGPVDAASLQLLREQMKEVLDGLSDRERSVIERRFGLRDGQARTLEEVGQEFGVTRERIRQIEAKALRKLRHPQRSRKLKDYLA